MEAQSYNAKVAPPGDLAVLAARIAELEGARTRDIVVYCRSGTRAAQALTVLEGAGFKRLLHLQGDYTRWAADSRPIATSQP